MSPTAPLLPWLMALGGDATVVTVDRIEGAWAVVEWTADEVAPVPLSALPDGISEGEHLELAWRRTTSTPPAAPACAARPSPAASAAPSPPRPPHREEDRP